MSKYCMLFLFLQPVSSLILTKPNGDPDMTSIAHHVTRMEQTISSLQTQIQTTNSELAAVKGLLQTTQDELVAVKEELRLSETDIATLRHHLQQRPDHDVLALLKSEVEDLKVHLGQTPNLTVIQSISADVKSNTNEIYVLKSQLLLANEDNEKAEHDLVILHSNISNLDLYAQTTSDELKAVEAEVANLTSLKLGIKVNHTISQGEANTLEMAALRSLVQDITESIVNITGDINNTRQALRQLTTKSEKSVAFQVTQQIVSNFWQNELAFNTVDFNSGNAYNKTSGIFTTPISGTYILWANVVFYRPTGFNRLYMHRGPQILAMGLAKLQTVAVPYDHRLASIMTVNYLAKGDRVFLIADTDTGSGWVQGSGESSFGGALLRVV